MIKEGEARGDIQSLEDAKAILLDELDKGVNCPCCGRFAKRYKRKLSSLMVRWLIALITLSPDGKLWVHSRDVFSLIDDRGSNANDYSYLEKWELIEPSPSDISSDTKAGRKPGRNGMWRPTEDGLLFARDELEIRERVILYNGNVEGFDGNFIDVVTSLGERFDYRELMSL